MMKDDPISNIEWRDAKGLQGNDYNPNRVFTPELKLLETSILKQGWVQPILINRDGVIIDGFHRAMLSRESKALSKKYQGKVPCSVVDIDRPAAMMLTIRINRAKGTHAAIRMASIVKELIDEHNVDPQQIAQEIGATKDEVDLLYQDGVFEIRKMNEYRYSKAWYPRETSRRK